MSIWQRIFGGGPRPALVVDHELASGQLAVRVVRHEIPVDGGSVPCWTYSTSGLAAAGQREIVLSLRSLPNENEAPSDPLRLFERLHEMACQGGRVEDGDSAGFFLDGGFLGRSGHVGFAFIPAQPLPGVDVLHGTLAAILLTEEEAALTEIISAYRVTALLARDARRYPCPPWSDRGRASVLTREAFEQSVLSTTPLAVYPGATVRMSLPGRAAAEQAAGSLVQVAGARVTLRLPLPQPPGFRDAIARLPDEWSLALLTRPDPDSTGSLVWSPGQDIPETITSGGDPTFVAGGFALLTAGASLKTGGKLLEDGFAVLMSPDAAAQTRKALLDAGPLLLAGEEGLFEFGLEWLPGGSDDPEAEPTAFSVHRTILYQTDDVLRDRVPSIEALSAYLRKVMEVSAEYWSRIEKAEARTVLLTVALRRGRSRFWADAEPALESILATPWLERLEALPVPEVRGPVAAALEATLWRAPGMASAWPFIPAEWQAACAGAVLLVPDGVLDLVWPA